ncbi:hypoxanthine-guanine phosphoribosyltransferase [Sulfuriferula nivalis]|uniref:Hypoxanthine-guanine phosphoribosyltransferase n=1 Tax=Sulfuriferula nivalis TaxID=2675298 RepID=A0A809SGK4_9PROT|nr:hypoxanthine-guanine phosphoribosyltransferase [Sulfuriferula nivalis]BBP00010.1 hypoxanthine-guanine phosphoribosyltransferase [Sulfuriferula nivalis]
MTNTANAWDTLNNAVCIYTAEEINTAIQTLAAAIQQDYADKHPLVITVMNGGMIFAGQLLPMLRFPLECDYLHASRYGQALHGRELAWIAMPQTDVNNRHIILLDDILDEGHTLAAIKQKLLTMGAASVACAVLTNKDINKEKPITADYVGLTLPNRYVFGCGMDVSGAWRNLPAIYAMP